MNPTPHLIADRYEVGELLGRGGMAEVRKGTDIRLGRTVAIKRLRADLAGDPTFQARFRREATSSASLNHPAIVAVYDTGAETVADAAHGTISQPYIVMEYVAGRTLRDILREGRKILPERALEITSGVLSALDYSHRMGIIHRDIKPANVMLTPSGEVKVMDFGIARAISDASSTMTQTHAVVGTAQYLSPEQARGEQVDYRSDVYSAGCLLYELLAGRPPFTGESAVAVAYQHVREQPLPPSTYDDELTPEVDAITLKALAKNRGERYQSAAEMRADIERYLAGQPVQAPAVAEPAPPVARPVPPVAATEPTTVIPAATPTTTIPVAQTEPGARRAEPERRSRKGLWITIALLLLAMAAAAAFLLPRLFPAAPEQVAVPDITNMNTVRAESALERVGLTLGQTSEAASPTVKAGDIIEQDPGANAMVETGTAVNVVVSTGKPDVTLPDLTGKTKTEVLAVFDQLGLRARFLVEESDLPADQVLRTDPPGGTEVAANSRIRVYVSDGPEQVPNVVGKTQAEAEQLLEAAGFVPSVIEDTTSTAPVGTVIKQSPTAGQSYPKGTEVTIVIAAGPTESPSISPSP